jgi:signal transduction histidine kinase
MDVLYTITLVTNGLTLALALVFLLLVLWQDPHNFLNQLFAVFLFTVVLWAAGSLLARGAAFVGAEANVITWGLRLLEAGFTGSVVALYMFAAVLAGVHRRTFYTISSLSILLFVVYQALIIMVRVYEPGKLGGLEVLRYAFSPGSTAFYLLFSVATIYLAWSNRRKIRERALVVGVIVFVAGQVIDLLSPDLRTAGLSVTVSAPAAMIMSFAIVRQRVMSPLTHRASQLEAVREVGLTITSRLSLDAVLGALARQAAELVLADGAAIFLLHDGCLELAGVYQLPEAFLGTQREIGEGVAGRVVQGQRSLNVEDFRLWEGEPDLPLAAETFGPLAAVPLMFGDDVVGVLEVIQGRAGRGFNYEDLRLLELLAPQAAVAIINGHLFEQQRVMTAELVASKDQLETILASTESPVVAVDRGLHILLANPAARALLPDPSVDVEGRRVTDLVPRSLLPKDVRGAIRELRTGRAYIYDVQHQGREYQCHLATLGGPYSWGWVALLNDVTRLKELDRMKSEMVRMTSHDLKNPLFAAMSYLELLDEEAGSALDEESHEYVTIIDRQLERMNRIISGILDLERVQAGTPLYETISLSRLTRAAAGELQQEALAKNLAMSVDWPTGFYNVLGDPQQLHQVFVNLIENAIKFTPEGGRVDLRLAQRGHWLMVEVCDTGVGIPEDALPHVFERFYRAPGAKDIKGSGLGLSLVKAIVEAHGGKVEAESQINVGSTFRVILPVADAVL